MEMSSPFNLEASLERARQRFGEGKKKIRKARSDRGQSRIPEKVLAKLRKLVEGEDYPGMTKIQEVLADFCLKEHVACPSRATIYSFLLRDSGPSYPLVDLPQPVQAALYNLDGNQRVPGGQLVFYCLNYGDLSALQYAAGMP